MGVGVGEGLGDAAALTVTSKVQVYCPYATVTVCVPAVVRTLGEQEKPEVTSFVPLLVTTRRVSPVLSSLSPTVYSTFVGRAATVTVWMTSFSSATFTVKVQVLPA